MFTREMSGITVTELRDIIDPYSGEVVVARPEDVTVDVSTSRTMSVRTSPTNTIDMPLSDLGMKAVAKWLDIPFKFLDRQDRDLQQSIVSSLVRKASGEIALEFNSTDGLIDARDPGSLVVSPKEYASIAARVISPEAQVVDFHADPDLVQFEVVPPEGFDRGWGGDRQVGDLTAGGLRIGQNRKQNLAPYVQPYFYRLVCTNGMETRDDGLRIDARGQTIDDLLMSLEMQAQIAFGRVEAEIASFYELRQQRVADPTQTVIRMAEEAGLPARTVLNIAERLPESVENMSDVSMFELVNLITNAANDPAIRNRLNIRRTLEQAGGQQVTSHIARCGHCRSRLN